jgi:hypothetical protein
MLGVEPDGSRRIEPAHNGCLVDPDGSRRNPSDRLDNQWDDQPCDTVLGPDFLVRRHRLSPPQLLADPPVVAKLPGWLQINTSRYANRSVMVGIDRGGDGLHTASHKPGHHGLSGLGGDALALPGHADRPGELGATAVISKHGLQHPHRLPVGATPDRPVALRRPVPVGGAARLDAGEGGPKVLQRPRLAAGEPIQALVEEHLGQRLGVTFDHRLQFKPSGQDALIG